MREGGATLAAEELGRPLPNDGGQDASLPQVVEGRWRRYTLRLRRYWPPAAVPPPRAPRRRPAQARSRPLDMPAPLHAPRGGGLEKAGAGGSQRAFLASPYVISSAI